MTRQEQFLDIQTKSAQFHKRARRVHDMIVERARQAARQANLDPNLLGIHPHNAMVSFRNGKPWKGVNYHYCRLSLHLQEKSWEPMRLYDQYATRLWKTLT